MTTNDYEARLARLEAATQADTVTVPDDWTMPADAALKANSREFDGVRPGDVFTNDGSGDPFPWLYDGDGCAWTADLAQLGLDVDKADEPAEPMKVTVSDAVPEQTGAIRGDFGYHAWVDQNGNVGGPLIDDADAENDDEEAADAADAAGFHLDEFQRERVAALEQALRILESRRAPSTSGTKTFADLFTKSGAPVVGVQDMVDVAAFIAEADTGRDEVQA